MKISTEADYERLKPLYTLTSAALAPKEVLLPLLALLAGEEPVALVERQESAGGTHWHASVLTPTRFLRVVASGPQSWDWSSRAETPHEVDVRSWRLDQAIEVSVTATDSWSQGLNTADVTWENAIAVNWPGGQSVSIPAYTVRHDLRAEVEAFQQSLIVAVRDV